MSCEQIIHRKFRIAETYAELRRRVDELELDLLEVATRRVHHQRFAEGDDTLLRARDGALQDDEVVLDDTVVREAAHRGDGLLRHIRLRRRVRLVLALANAVDLLVELRTVVVTVCKRILDRVSPRRARLCVL